MSNEELDKAAREYAEKHSSAPDKETPDWIINDFKAGAKWAMDLKEKEENEPPEDGRLSITFNMDLPTFERFCEAIRHDAELWRELKEELKEFAKMLPKPPVA